MTVIAECSSTSIKKGLKKIVLKQIQNLTPDELTFLVLTARWL